MLHEKIIEKYYALLCERDLNGLLTIFSVEATVEHPIFGTMAIEGFLRKLLDCAKSHEQLSITNFFTCETQPERVAVFMMAKFTATDNTKFIENAVHIFDFTQENLLKKIIVVIDTFPFREQYYSGPRKSDSI